MKLSQKLNFCFVLFFKGCGGLNRYVLHRLMCVNAWPQGVMLLGGVALLEEVNETGRL